MRRIGRAALALRFASSVGAACAALGACGGSSESGLFGGEGKSGSAGSGVGGSAASSTGGGFTGGSGGVLGSSGVGTGGSFGGDGSLGSGGSLGNDGSVGSAGTVGTGGAAGASADGTAGTAGGGTGGVAGGGVLCGTGECNLAAGERCCVRTPGQDNCYNPGAGEMCTCAGALCGPGECDGPTDCQQGEVCCASLSGILCQANCPPGNSFEICQDNDAIDCRSGGACVASTYLPGFKACM